MPDKHLRFHSSNGKRQLLIASAHAEAAEPLAEMLRDRYELLSSHGYDEMLATIILRRDTLSLVILDLEMPDMSGLDALQKLKAESGTARLPIMVVSSQLSREAQCLRTGAIDFIAKPYPPADVMLARVQRSIELSENREIISLTERDPMTGLFNREYFYRYGVQFDAYHKDMPMDAIVVNINHFRMINERYGRSTGDEIIRQIGQSLRNSVAEAGGIVCRRNGDVFLVYCPHREDYEEILDNASVLPARRNIHLRLRMGVYPNVDKTLEIERRFDHAKMALDAGRGSYNRRISFYDKALHDAELLSSRLLEDFNEAIEGGQFLVYYQPKYDIRRSDPVLNSAEALVRWRHPELGMIRPDQFIALFEENGLIPQLDNYIWRQVAAQMARWRERFGKPFPVSVNVSRVDMYDPDFVANMTALVREFGIRPEDFLLEITESAYTQDSEQIVENVKRLRDAGFLIEMDDFGSGYSSLNMISTLPIDVIKLDMQFIRNAFKEQGNTRMLEAVIGIADSLYVPTVAEGVETAEQLQALRAMGCDVAQGYYFSKPVPPEVFEKYIEDRMGIDEASAPIELSHRAPRLSDRNYSYDALHDPPTGLYNYTAFDMLVKDADRYHTALLIAQVNEVSSILEEKGQIEAERVLRHAADFLRRSFRSVDHICRISSCEFAVIMTRVDSSIHKQLIRKIEHINARLKTPQEGVPPVSLTVGAAFADRVQPDGSILADAEAALDRQKESGQAGCAVY